MLKTEGLARGFKHLLKDLTNVYALEKYFIPNIEQFQRNSYKRPACIKGLICPQGSRKLKAVFHLFRLVGLLEKKV